MGSKDILGFLEEKRPFIDSKIREYLPDRISKAYMEFLGGSAGHEHDLEALNKAIAEPIWDFLNRGGKRWRPALFLLIAEALGADMKRIQDFSIVTELAHEGSIMIDDIEDNGEMRRGRPCTHKIYGTDIAINAGSIMYFLPLAVFIKNRQGFGKDTMLRAYEVFSEEMINIHIGQGTDIYWHKGMKDTMTEGQYLQMCAFKTGSLSRMAARLAVVLSDGDREKEEKLGKLGEAIGVAFQIKDDVLSLTGEEFANRKGYGDDITEGKRSLSVIHTLKKASQADRKRLVEILNMHTTDRTLIGEAMGIIKKYHAPEYAMNIAGGIINSAWQEAELLLPDSRAKCMLKDLLNFLLEREM